MERKASLLPLFRNKNAPKAPDGGVSRVGYQLVRMRSPVQIWIAAPQKPLKSLDLGGFCLICSTFRGRLKFSKDLLAGGMGFLQKILQFLRGSRASKLLCRNGFWVFHPANTLQLPGLLPRVGAVNNGGGFGDSFPALDVVTQGRG